MKKRIFFSLLWFIWGCQRDDGLVPVNDKMPIETSAVFRVRYQQSGDLEGFVKTFQCDTDSATDQDFVWYDTKQPAPSYFTGEGLLGQVYDLETKVPMEELRPLVDISWNNARALTPGWQGPDQIEVSLTVWRNDTIIDHRVIRASSENPPASISIDSVYHVSPRD